jgi:hypothetical protein
MSDAQPVLSMVATGHGFWHLSSFVPLPELPPTLDAATDERLLVVRDEIIDLVERSRTCAVESVRVGDPWPT